MMYRLSRRLAWSDFVVVALVAVAGCKRASRPAPTSIEPAKDEPAIASTSASASTSTSAFAAPRVLGANEVRLVVKEVAQNVSSFARRVAGEKGEPANVVVYRRNAETCAYGRVVGDALAHLGSL